MMSPDWSLWFAPGAVSHPWHHLRSGWEFSKGGFLDPAIFGVHETNIDHSFRLETYPFFRLIALHLDLENELNTYIPKKALLFQLNYFWFNNNPATVQFVYILWWPFKVRSFYRSHWHDRSTGHASAFRFPRIGDSEVHKCLGETNKFSFPRNCLLFVCVVQFLPPWMYIL